MKGKPWRDAERGGGTVMERERERVRERTRAERRSRRGRIGKG